MNTIFKYFVEHPKLVNLLLVLVLVMGIVSFINLKRDSLPSVDFKMMYITTFYPGAAAKDVEINVTVPIEEQLQDVSGIKNLNSYSTENFSAVFVEIDPNIKDAEKVKSDVTKAVDRVANLPQEITDRPLVTELKTDIFPVFEVALSGKVPELELRKYARTIEKKMRQLPGVGGTQKIGYRKREIKIEVDPEKAERNYLSLSEVMAAIQASNIRLSGGTVLSLATKKKIVTLDQFEELLDVKDVIVRSVFSGRRLRVSDVAQVRDDFEKENLIIKSNGKPCINIIISKKEEADAVRVAKEVNELLEECKKCLPAGVEAQVVKDYSKYVSSYLTVVMENALIGFVLVILCLMLVLDIRVAFWTALGIPFSLLVTFYFMPVYDIAITIVSLLAIVIVLGMLVDDAIVVAEHIYSYREKGIDPIEASVEGVSEIFWPVVATVTTTIAAFIPVLLMGGIFGEWLRALPIVITILLAASLFESAFILPSHLAHTRLKLKGKPKFISFLEGVYQRNLHRVLRRKKRVIGFFALLFIFSVGVILPIIGFELYPSTDNDLLQIRIETPKGTPIHETERRVQKVEKIIEETVPKEILVSYVTTIGQKGTEAWSQVSGLSQSHWARIVVNFIPRQERRITVFQLQKNLETKIKKLLNTELTEADVITQVGGPPVGKPIDVTFIGNDEQIRTELADKLYNFVSTREGVYGVTRDDEAGPVEINVRLNHELMSELGITALDVAQVVRTAYDGTVVTSIRKEGEEVDYRILVAEKYQTDPRYIKNLTIPNRAGKLIKLGSFIRFEEKESPLAIRHQDGDRSVTIQAEVDSQKLNAAKFNQTIREKFEPLVAQYPDFRLKFGGIEQSTVESLKNFYGALVIALVVIYIILVVLFNSFTQPIVVMLAIPFGLIGVIFAFAIHFTPLTFLGLIGILGLAGVVVNNSLVMLKFLNEKQKAVCAEGEQLKLEQVAEAATRRFRPMVHRSSCGPGHTGSPNGSW